VHEIDLKSDEGQRRLHTWLREADLLLASQRPSALRRLRLDADTVLAPEFAAPNLRHLNIVGEIAQPEVPGHDLTYMARARLLGSEMPRTLVADILGSERAVSTALLLLRRPPGAREEVGLFDALAPLTAPMRHGVTGPGSVLEDRTPWYGIYPTRDGRVAVAALEPHFRVRLYFAARSATEWETWADERDLPIAAVR
jgi:crotonobetainyl-CoA:carnitine CoA-transferase CaiB-like acyl-CoA transferase